MNERDQRGRDLGAQVIKGAALVMAGVALAGCLGSEDDDSRRASPEGRELGSDRPVVVMREGHRFPPGCGIRATARRVDALFEAANAGDRAALTARVGEPGDVHWFSVSERGLNTRAAVDLGGGTYGDPISRAAPREIVDYLLARQRLGERLRLHEIEVVPVKPRAWLALDVPLAGVNFEISRRFVGGRDRGAARDGGGKGGLTCDGRLVVWAMGWKAGQSKFAATCLPSGQIEKRKAITACGPPRVGTSQANPG